MRKLMVLATVALALSAGLAASKTDTGKTIESRFGKIVGQAKEKAKEKGREYLDAGKKAKEAAKDLISEVADKVIDHFVPGGDNRPTKAIAHSAIQRDSWWKAFLKATFTPSATGESQFTDPQQVVTDQPIVPANPSNDNAITTQHVSSTPVVPANASNENAAVSERGGILHPEHDQTSTTTEPAASAAEHTDAGAGAPQPPAQTIQLRAGENTWVQGNTNPNINPNPELTHGVSSAPAPSPVAPAPTPAATPQPAPAPQPAPTPPQDRVGPIDHGPAGGAERIDNGHEFNGRDVDAAGHIG